MEITTVIALKGFSRKLGHFYDNFRVYIRNSFHSLSPCTGIFITNVLPDSRAHKSGLRPGYQILKINAFPLKESTHEEAVSLLTLKRAYILTCKDIGELNVTLCNACKSELHTGLTGSYCELRVTLSQIQCNK